MGAQRSLKIARAKTFASDPTTTTITLALQKSHAANWKKDRPQMSTPQDSGSQVPIVASRKANPLIFVYFIAFAALLMSAYSLYLSCYPKKNLSVESLVLVNDKGQVLAELAPTANSTQASFTLRSPSGLKQMVLSLDKKNDPFILLNGGDKSSLMLVPSSVFITELQGKTPPAILLKVQNGQSLLEIGQAWGDKGIRVTVDPTQIKGTATFKDYESSITIDGSPIPLKHSEKTNNEQKN
jgi:hypothetical protein